MAIDAVKKDMVLIGRTTDMKGLTAGWEGNMSVRIKHALSLDQSSHR